MSKPIHLLLGASVVLVTTVTGCVLESHDVADVEGAPGLEENIVILPTSFLPPTPPPRDRCLERNDDTWTGAPYTNGDGQICVDTYGEHCVRTGSGICACEDILVSVTCEDPPLKDPPIKLPR